MKVLKIVLIFVAVFGVFSCNEDPKVEDTVTTYYFVRHAEKDRSNPENVDPELTQWEEPCTGQKS